MFNRNREGEVMDDVTTVGIDLAKNVFSVHGVDAQGQVRLRKTISRSRLVGLVAQLPRCLIGFEACTGAHEWARQFAGFGHTVKLMAPKFGAPYRRGSKNDGNDAAAICEAVSRPSMRFVPVKTLEQQAILTLHRVRQGFIEERTRRSTGYVACWRSSASCSHNGRSRSGAVRPRRWIGCPRKPRGPCGICLNRPGLPATTRGPAAASLSVRSVQ
jgi:transposase